MRMPTMKIKYRMFDRSQRSSFPYWFWHWLAFNMTAIRLRAWKFHHLFHDIEKPWLRLFWEYKKVQTWHRTHNRHHLEYPRQERINWRDLCIDWESCHLTKTDEPRTARQEMERYCSDPKSNFDQRWIRSHMEPELNKLGL